jgi:tRNA (guanine26-N2/guanine27-N2)-dimethyltransferase
MNCYEGFPFKIYQEGITKVYIPDVNSQDKSNKLQKFSHIFFNPVMELNRDISVIALRSYQKLTKRKLIICEPMTGIGIRGIRYALEVEGVEKVILNDIDPRAVSLSKINIYKNGLSKKIELFNADSHFVLNLYAGSKKRFNVIDLDPFGSPSPFIDSAVRSLNKDGLIALTATDTAPLCGVHPEACLRKYFGKPLRTEYCHELAVRLLIGCLIRLSARHDLGIDVFFSHSTDHYIRVYAQMKHGARIADDCINQLGYVLHCFNCYHREISIEINRIQNKKGCPLCGKKMYTAGPLWVGVLYNKKFTENMLFESHKNILGTKKRLTKLLLNILEEINAPPTFYVIDKISEVLGEPSRAKKEVINNLQKLGFQATSTHFHPKGIRTDASVEAVKSAIKNCHCRD